MSWVVNIYIIVFLCLTAWTLWSGIVGWWTEGRDDWKWMWVFWLAWPFLILVLPVGLYEWWRDRRAISE